MFVRVARSPPGGGPCMLFRSPPPPADVSLKPFLKGPPGKQTTSEERASPASFLIHSSSKQGGKILERI